MLLKESRKRRKRCMLFDGKRKKLSWDGVYGEKQ